jgi:uncharacterized protein (DUF934 family)
MHMRDIIKDRAIVPDDWQVLHLAEGDTAESVAIPAGRVIVPLAVWQARRDSLKARGDVAVWLASDERPEALKDDLDALPLVAVDFPKFADGRGYSTAYNLRARFGYQGELRAIGDVLRDQLFYMQRVGFDAFELRADQDVNAALQAFKDFTECYQGAIEPALPLFRRRAA